MATRRLRTATLGTTVALLGASLWAGGGASLAADSFVSPAEARVQAASTWHLAASLGALREEVNFRWPYRSRASDGTIGDYRHSTSYSEHNPVGHSNGPANGTPGSVHAMDITASGIDATAVLDAVIGDPRVKYVIHTRTIWSRTYGWAARTYYGDSHNSHIHISLRSETMASALAAESDTSPWLTRPGAGMRPGRSGEHIRALQQALIDRGYVIEAGATGYFGEQTLAAVKAFQRAQGWSGDSADGIPGAMTLTLLGLLGSPTPDPTPTPPPTTRKPAKISLAKISLFRMGAEGRYVRKVQRALILRGYDIPAGVTGYFGRQTRLAVRAFQIDQGFVGRKANGIPNKRTLNRLDLLRRPPR